MLRRDFNRLSINAGLKKVVLTVAVFCLLGVTTHVSGQVREFTITGTVRDAADSMALARVNVVITETSQGSVTDEKGGFVISGVKEGLYTLRVSMTGYRIERSKVSVRTGEGMDLEIYLQPQVYQLDSVVITARKEIRDIIKAPYTEPFSLMPAISRISSGELAKQGATTVTEALNHLPGSLTETRGRQVKQFFSVRSQKYPYPDYAVNGIWQQEFQEIPYFFSASDIEEIEIVRSSAALLTGLSGISGIVNIKTKEYTVPETNAEIEYGSYNSFHGHLSNGGKIGKLGYRLGVGFDRTEGPEGKHARENMANLHAGINWQLSEKLGLKATLFGLDAERQLRKAEPPADARYRDLLQSFDPYRAIISNVKIAWRPSEKLSSEVQLFYTFRDPTFIDEVKATSTSEKDTEAGVNFMQSISLSGANTLRFGGLYNHWIAPNGKRFYLGKRCDTETFSGVIVDEQQLGRFTLDAGIRYTQTYFNDYAAFNIEGEGGMFKNLTPVQDTWEPGIFQGSLGATWRYDNLLSFYFNSAAGQIQPRRGALTTDRIEPENETRLKADLGIIKKFRGSGKIMLAAFGVLQKNAIALSGTTYTDQTSGEVRELYVNREQNQRGVEFEITPPRLLNLVSPFLNFTLMKSELEKNGELVVNKENPVLISSCGLYFSRRGVDLNIFGKYVSPFENERFASPSSGPQPLGDFLSIDLTGGYTFMTRFPVRLHFKIKNMTDRKYSTVIGYPDYGRMIYIGMNYLLRGTH